MVPVGDVSRILSNDGAEANLPRQLSPCFLCFRTLGGPYGGVRGCGRDIFPARRLFFVDDVVPAAGINSNMRQFDLTTPIGYDGAADLKFLLTRIEEIVLAPVPLAKGVRNLRTGEEDQSSGRNAEDARDYVF